MNQVALTKISAKSAAEICALYKLSKQARTLFREDQTPSLFIETLVGDGKFLDAMTFLAYALPKREAIWWACLSVRHAQGPALPPSEFAALKAAVEWVLEPDEAKRRAAQAAGEAADFSTPAGCAALAVYGSGGSLGPPNLPEAPPEPNMTARAVSGSIVMVSVKGDPKSMLDVQRELVELGIAIAEGKYLWPVVTTGAAKSPAVGSARGQRF